VGRSYRSAVRRKIIRFPHPPHVTPLPLGPTTVTETEAPRGILCDWRGGPFSSYKVARTYCCIQEIANGKDKTIVLIHQKRKRTRPSPWRVEMWFHRYFLSLLFPCLYTGEWGTESTRVDNPPGVPADALPLDSLKRKKRRSEQWYLGKRGAVFTAQLQRIRLPNESAQICA